MSGNILIKQVIFLFIITCKLFAQSDEVIVSGFVRDAATGEALIGTNILLYKSSIISAIPYRGVASNRYGFYAFPGLSKGAYAVEFRNIGYRTHIDTIIISISNGSLRLDVELKSEDILLNEVIVSGERESKAIVSEIKLSGNILKSLPSMSGELDIFKSLELLPGVKTASELSNGLYIRGGSPDQTLTLIDNMIIYNPSHLGNFASTFNSNAVQDIILVKGAFPSEYGGRLSSVLDIKLRSGTKEKEKVALGIGTLNSHLLLEGPLSEQSTYIISGRTMYYDMIQKGFFKNSENPLYNFHDLNAKFTYNLSDNDALSISSFYSKDRLYSPSSLDDIEYETSWLNGSVSLNWLHSGERYISNTTLSFIEYQFESRIDNNLLSVDASDYFASSKLSDFIFSNDFEIFAHENHKLKTGLQVLYHSYNLIASDIYHYSLEIDSDLRTKINSLEAAFYFQAESQLTSRLKTNIGLRTYYFKDQKQLNLEPRISFMFYLLDNFSLKGAASVSHQYLHLLTRDDISLPTDFWFPSTRKILPGKSSEYVTGFEYRTDNQEYTISLEAYYRDMKDIYEFKDNAKFRPTTPVDELLTKGEGEAYGIEFFLNKSMGKFTGWIGFTHSYTRRLFNDLNLGRIFYPRYDRRNDASLVIAYKFSEQFSASATWTYATGQGMTMPYGQFQAQQMGMDQGSEILLLYTERNGHKLPAHHKLDISFTYDIKFEKSDMTIYCTLFNLYNRQNVFAQYLLLTEQINNETGQKEIIPQVKQIVLFPFIPAAGIKINL